MSEGLWRETLCVQKPKSECTARASECGSGSLYLPRIQPRLLPDPQCVDGRSCGAGHRGIQRAARRHEKHDRLRRKSRDPRCPHRGISAASLQPMRKKIKQALRRPFFGHRSACFREKESERAYIASAGRSLGSPSCSFSGRHDRTGRRCRVAHNTLSFFRCPLLSGSLFGRAAPAQPAECGHPVTAPARLDIGLARGEVA